MDREELQKLWDEAWKSGLWAATWKASIDGLTPEQAAWKPAAERHSIWQIVLHLCFWRGVTMGRMRGQTSPPDAVIARENYPAIESVTADTWDAARRRLAESQQRVREAIADPACEIRLVPYLLFHDNYHVGQINYLRAMQGLKPIE